MTNGTPADQNEPRQNPPQAASNPPAIAEPTPTSIVSAPTRVVHRAPHNPGPPPPGLTPTHTAPGVPDDVCPPRSPQWPPADTLPPGGPQVSEIRQPPGSADPTTTLRRADAPAAVSDSADDAGSDSQGTHDSQRQHTSGPMSGSGTGRSRRSRGTGRSSSRMRLGGGLVEIPRPTARDPQSAILSVEKIAKVGAQPKLSPGDLVAGQYEVLGCLAHGGLGWVYLAKDRNVSDRWVVLKGLLDTGDETAMAAAVAEQRFLAEVEHPNIVKIYNFVQHPDPDTGNQVGYIVMEYVGGQSLRQLFLSNVDSSGRPVPLPLAQVLAYGLEVLPALGYLHSIGLLYCDLKPDNVIQTHEGLKLIDLGAVRRMDDWESPIFFTSGYAAPELATEGPSVSSDIHTVGRMLAVMSFDFTGYRKDHRYSLPTPNEVPLFALFESYYRLLCRATDPDPTRRFSSCEEMADQVTGVLREVLALSTKEPRPGRSTSFGAELRTFGSEVMTVHEHSATPRPPDWSEVTTGLPMPQVDTNDVAAGLLGAITTNDPNELLATLATAPGGSVEAKLARARVRIERGDLAGAQRDLDEAAAIRTDEEDLPLPPNWRVDWYRGLLSLAARRPRDARVAFDVVYDLVPGELAPKLALAASAEYCGDFFAASRLYELVWRTDHSYVSAAFGLARVYLAQGDRSGALEVLESVPDRSSQYLDAQLAAITTRIRSISADRLTEQDLVLAASRLERLPLDAERRNKVSISVLQAALDWVQAGKPGATGRPPGNYRVLGCALEKRDLRFGLERGYRALARLTTTKEERFALVDKANEVRPRTLT